MPRERLIVLVQSPNAKVWPVSARVNARGHLEIGGADTVELAETFGTPLWVMDEQTITDAATAYVSGFKTYPDALVLYAGKAFLCLAMCRLIQKLGLGLDVVSEGELYTAIKAGVEPQAIYLHGNNKSEREVKQALEYGDTTIVVDNLSELHMVASIAASLGRKAQILLRVIPAIGLDTHEHIITGHAQSKFGIPLEDVDAAVKQALDRSDALQLQGVHAHIGSQAYQLQPYLEYIDILIDLMARLKQQCSLTLSKLDVGGGLGIAYTDEDKTLSIAQWCEAIATHTQASLKKRGLQPPKLLVEPGRSIVGTAGVTLYRAGHKKTLPAGVTYLSVDGGMADNPRPVTYGARYTAAVASRMNAPALSEPIALSGKYCESGDIIIKETYIPAEKGDLIAVFGTGAYNYSMASNYNRTGRPACVLLSAGTGEVIIERETNEDLIRKDRIPDRLR